MTLLKKLEEMGYPKDESKRYLMAGKVFVNEVAETFGNRKLKENDIVRVKVLKQWVSRGAYKLLGAIEDFNLNFKNEVAIDIGSSTGGFTQVLIENKAKKVYSVDVGTNQLDYKLRNDSRIVAMEKTNLKVLTPSMFEEEIDSVVTDVSFISLKRVFDVLVEVLKPGGKLMALIKPQFEANSNLVEEGGYVDEKYHQEIIEDITNYAKERGFSLLNIKESPITGKKTKNIEYITHFRKEL